MPSNITPPRVPIANPETGIVSREWYNFFLSLFDLAGAGQNSLSLTDLQLTPPVIPPTPVVAVDPIPTGLIAFFLVSTPPTGWEEVIELRGRFPRGMASGGTPGTTGGTDKHTHGTGGTGTGAGSTSSTGSTSTGRNMRDGTGVTITLSEFPHNHNIPEATTLNPYLNGMWCRKL